MMRRVLVLYGLALSCFFLFALIAAGGEGFAGFRFFKSSPAARPERPERIDIAEMDYSPDDASPGWHMAAGFTDEGDLTGVAMNPESHTPVVNALAEIALYDGTVIDTQYTDSLGKFTFINLQDDEYKITLSDPGFKDTEIWTGVVMDQVSQLPEGKIIMEPVIHHGKAGGSVTNALTGITENNVRMEFRAGINPPDTEPILYTVTTGVFGNYNLNNGLAGVYTATLSKTHFEDAACVIYVLGSKTVSNQNCVLSPHLEDDEIRIVLTWGATPADLDSHLWAPSYPCSPGGFHLYFSTIGTNPCTANYDLDLDDVSSYGPETTSIYHTTNGTYRFLVHDYTNLSCTGSGCTYMANSGAKVSVITSTQTFDFYVTPGVSATVWRVLEIDGVTQAINYLNQYTFQSTPSLVQ